jgi:hypothetical protein
MAPSTGNDAPAKDIHVEMLDDPIKPSQADHADIEDRPLKERQLLRKIDIRMSVILHSLYAKMRIRLLTFS